MPVALPRRFSMVAAAAVIATSPLLISAPSAEASPRLICQARMSDSTPAQYSNVSVNVKTGRKEATVRTVAHYKTTDTRKTRKSNRDAKASVNYYISGATPGYRVKVDVTVTKGKQTRTCSTAFTPHR